MIKNIICGVAGLVLAAAYFIVADDLPRSLLSDPTGADGLPKLLALMLGTLSSALIVDALIRRPVYAPDKQQSLSEYLRSAGMLGLGILYLAALPWLGYPLTIFLFLLAVAVYSGMRFGVTPIAVSLAGAAVLWGSFVYLFGIRMPAGHWPALLG